MKAYLICAVIVISSSATVLADSWVFPNKLVKKEYSFGETTLVLEIDGTKDQAFPPHTLLIYSGEKLLAKHKDVGFDKVYPSKDNRFFVGVSNRGIPGTAFVVFDAKGKLLRAEKHRSLPRGVHTDGTVTLWRVWYDEREPNVEFELRDGRLVAVFIRGSNKQTYNLLERDLGFRDVDGKR